MTKSQTTIIILFVAQESPRIQELCDNLENHQTIVKKSRRGTTKSNINKTSEISMNKSKIKDQNIAKGIDNDEKIQEI